MDSKIAIVIFALVGFVITLTAAAALSDSTTIPLDGTISTINVEAYSDSACTHPINALDMGNVSPGNSYTQTIYIKNSGNIPMTLTMTTNGWIPTGASSYLSLSWNRQNYILDAGDSVSATLTLTVASDTGSLTTFSCDITIIGAE